MRRSSRGGRRALPRKRGYHDPLTAAVAAAGKGTYVLDGVERMRERPIQDLVDGLKQLGVDAECTMGRLSLSS